MWEPQKLSSEPKNEKRHTQLWDPFWNQFGLKLESGADQVCEFEVVKRTIGPNFNQFWKAQEVQKLSFCQGGVAQIKVWH